MDCYLRGKTFYGREWVFQKLLHCLNLKSPEKQKGGQPSVSGVLITGNSGTGKSAICAELVTPTAPISIQAELSTRILAYHFCQSHDFESLTPARLVMSLATQILTSSVLANQMKSLLEAHPQLNMLMNPHFCARYPSQCAHTLAQLLRDLPPPEESLILLIDSVHETQVPTQPRDAKRRQDNCVENESESKPANPKSIANLIGQIAPLIPDWLLLVCTARRHWSGSSRFFGSFRKLVLDDLKKSAVICDTQSYILRRIDDDPELYDLLVQKPETAELLNQLHIKSNGCLLYLEKILDGLVDGLLKLSELAHIPGTLNGLYLWLCQRIFSKKQFELVRPALNVLLAANRPLTRKDLRVCWILRRLDDNPALFDQIILKLLKRILIVLPNSETSDSVSFPTPDVMSSSDIMTESFYSDEDQVILFHNSFAEWLRDVKHCTQRYLCSFPDGQHSLAMLYSTKVSKLTPSNLVYFCQCLDQTMPKDADPAVLQAWLIQSGIDLNQFRHLPSTEDIPDSILPILPSPESSETSNDEEVLRYFASIHSASSSQSAYPSALTTSGSLESGFGIGSGLESRSFSQMSSQSTANPVSGTSMDSLIQAAREGWDSKIHAMLNNPYLSLSPDGTDSEGWTPLRGASWAGHVSTVELLLKHGASVDYADDSGRTALRAAAWAGHDKIVLL